MAGCPVHGQTSIQNSAVIFYPNDQVNKGAPVPEPSVAELPMPILENAWIKRYGVADDEDHYSQAGDFFRIMNEAQKQQLTTTIAEGLVQAEESVQKRMLEQFGKADANYAARIVSIMSGLR